MNHQAHKVAGVCAGTITATLLYSNDIHSGNTLIAIAPMILGGYIGGLLPDIDHPGSKMGRALYPIAYVVNKLFGHRGATHSLIALILTSILVLLPSFLLSGMPYFLYTHFAIGISVGFLSHLILDMSTKSGVPLLYPFIRKSYRIAKLTTGKHDMLVAVIAVMITATTIYLSI
ncbi:hypothetical protein JMA_41660 (plasmid) [Jeotgalibacillus malaysiensis]|uniref:Hydrolase n=1 Tax=Jeotgalibacillus malaysiensis TaxID=1508404 RepID=A0A0B5AY87_9BACL|nr:metal-dependent hydrolase [Jeotgalibacillus malaysiensis]AJD93483.1 hypothetical protein JMA_41660 [Jeotgalibacillus malaysiensis]